MLLCRIAEEVRGIHPEGEMPDTPPDTEVEVVEAPATGVGSLIEVLLLITLEWLRIAEAVADGRVGGDPPTNS